MRCIDVFGFISFNHVFEFLFCVRPLLPGIASVARSKSTSRLGTTTAQTCASHACMRSRAAEGSPWDKALRRCACDNNCCIHLVGYLSVIALILFHNRNVEAKFPGSWILAKTLRSATSSSSLVLRHPQVL